MLSSDSYSSKCFIYTIGEDILTMEDNFIDIGKGIFHLGSDEMILAASLLGGIALSSIPEMEIRDWNVERMNDVTYEKYKSISSLAKREYIGLFAAGVYFGGLVSGTDRIRRTGLKLITAMTLSGIITGSFKVILGKARPWRAEHLNDYRFFEMSNDFQAMPSGHSTVAFCVATILAGEIDRWWATVPLYATAGLVAWSRIYLNQHFLSDVIAGASVGTLSALAVLNVNKKIEIGGKELTILPDVYRSGISISIKF